MTGRVTSVLEALTGTVDRVRGDLVAVSHQIHARPELAFEERFASGLLADALEAGRRDRDLAEEHGAPRRRRRGVA